MTDSSTLPVIQPFTAESDDWEVEAIIQGDFAAVMVTLPSGGVVDLSPELARQVAAMLTKASGAVELHRPVPFTVTSGVD